MKNRVMSSRHLQQHMGKSAAKAREEDSGGKNETTVSFKFTVP